MNDSRARSWILDFLYNKALATTLEGSRKSLGGTYSRLGCDETGGLTEIWGYIGKNIEGQNFGNSGSGVIQVGSYFGTMTPRGSGSFLNGIFGLPRPKNPPTPLAVGVLDPCHHCTSCTAAARIGVSSASFSLKAARPLLARVH